MFTDYMLKFTNEAEANSVLFVEHSNAQGDVVETVKVPKYTAIDVIGTIYKPTGKTITNDEGDFPEMKPIPGWHVNVRHTEPAEELNQFAVMVDNPVRNWF